MRSGQVREMVGQDRPDRFLNCKGGLDHRVVIENGEPCIN